MGDFLQGIWIVNSLLITALLVKALHGFKIDVATSPKQEEK